MYERCEGYNFGFCHVCCVSLISRHNSSLTVILETGLTFLIWTQGEISPSKWGSPVNRAHVKRPLFYSQNLWDVALKIGLWKCHCMGTRELLTPGYGLLMAPPIYTICDMKSWTGVSSQLDPQRIMNNTFICSISMIWVLVSCLFKYMKMSQLSLKMNLILIRTAFKALDYENSF